MISRFSEALVSEALGCRKFEGLLFFSFFTGALCFAFVGWKCFFGW